MRQAPGLHRGSRSGVSDRERTRERARDMVDSFEQSAVRGEWMWAVRWALVTGGLWATGSAWATAIRSVVITMLPEDTQPWILVCGELGAALFTTVFVASIAVLVISGKQCRDTRRLVHSVHRMASTRRRGASATWRTTRRTAAEPPPVAVAVRKHASAARLERVIAMRRRTDA